MARHETPGRTDEWYTPPYVFDALGCRFDLDVAYPCITAPHVPADRFLRQDSLDVDWSGFIWMNPPFGKKNGLVPWLRKFFTHGNGIALTPDRTSAPWWQEAAIEADAILFWAPKIHFIPGPGVVKSSPAQGTTLLAAGARGVDALTRAASLGHGVLLS